jgi:hypothetical protein
MGDNNDILDLVLRMTTTTSLLFVGSSSTWGQKAEPFTLASSTLFKKNDLLL